MEEGKELLLICSQKYLGTTEPVDKSTSIQIILLIVMWLFYKASVPLVRKKIVILTFTSVIAISTTLPTTIKASKVFQASAK